MTATRLDGVGYRKGKTAYSLYGCQLGLAGEIRAVLNAREGMVEGDPWYQSDHSLFVFNDVPALAFTSDHFNDLWTKIAHTADDVPQIVDPAHLVEVAIALRDLVDRLT